MFKVLLKSDKSTFVTERFRSMMEITYIFCITAHILMVLNFFYQGLTELVLFNVFFTFPLISSALILNHKNKIQLAFMMILIEFYTHQCLSIYFLGWKSGYQYFLIYLSVIPFFYPYWGKHFQVLISSATIFLYLILFLTSTDSGVFQLSEHQYTISHVINCLLGVSLFILLTNYYVNNTTVREETLDQLVKEKTLQQKEGQRAAIYMLGEAGHFHDDATGSHIWRMAMYSKVLAKRCGWNEDDADLIELAAAMHDTGKIGVPDAVLKKPGKLDADEWEIMKSHCEIGFSILSKSKGELFQRAAEIALNHHEKWDGSGYPQGISGESIPQSARIVAIADVFDALTMKRPYKEPWPIEDAFLEIEKNSGSHFDPALVESFLSMKDEIKAIYGLWDESTQDDIACGKLNLNKSG